MRFSLLFIIMLYPIRRTLQGAWLYDLIIDSDAFTHSLSCKCTCIRTIPPQQHAPTEYTWWWLCARPPATACPLQSMSFGQPSSHGLVHRLTLLDRCQSPTVAHPLKVHVFCVAAWVGTVAGAEALVRFPYFTLYLIHRVLQGAWLYDLIIDSREHELTKVATSYD